MEATVHLTGRTIVKRFNGYRLDHRNNLDFHRHRFPGTSVSELNDTIALFGRQLGRFDGIVARQISEHIYSIGRP